MFKKYFNWRNVVAIAISLAATTMFSACGDNEEQNNDGNGGGKTEITDGGKDGGSTTDKGPGTGGDPALAIGYIWQSDARSNQGMLFENGSVYMLYYGLPGNTDSWSGRERIGTWEEGSNTIEAVFSADPDVTFTVNGDKLHEYSVPDNVLRATYTKTAATILGQ